MFEKLAAMIREVLPDPAGLDDAALVDFAADVHRLEAVLAERTLTAAAELFTRRAAEHRETHLWTSDAIDQAEAEVGAALTLGRGNAGALVGLGLSLTTRLPATRAALAAGKIDVSRARLIDSCTCNVTAELIERVEEAAVAAASGGDGKAPITGARLRHRIDRIVARIDPDGMRERHRRAREDRHVHVGAEADGMSEVSGSLPAADGRTLTGRLDEIARTVCADDPRSYAARRADALIAMCHGQDRLVCGCGRDDCPRNPAAAGHETRARKPLVHVIATAATVAGTSDDPGFLDGYGIVDPDTVRDLAGAGTIRPLDPDLLAGINGRTTDRDLTYRPTQALADAVRAMHGTCQWPNCDAAVWNCDLDHTEPFDHDRPERGGRTVGANLGPYCRRHHRIKHSGGWTDARTADGGIILISPTGHGYRTSPAGGVPLLTDLHPRHGAEAESPARGVPLLTDLDASDLPPPKSRTREQQRATRIRAERRRQHARRSTASPAAGPDNGDDPPPF